MSEKKWCEEISEMLSEGKWTGSILSTIPDKKWKNQLKKWQNVCKDPSLQKLRSLERKGTLKAKQRQEDSDRRLKYLLNTKLPKEAASGRYLTDKEKKEKAQLNSGTNDVWSAVKTSCQTAVKVLDKARSESETHRAIKIYNNNLARTFHNFLATADKWLGNANKAKAVYYAFVAIKKVDPNLAAKDPKKYALQMGTAVKNIGKVLKGLPAPFSAYGTFLEKSGEFFSNMSHALIPGERTTSRDYRPGGRYYNQYDRVYTGK